MGIKIRLARGGSKKRPYYRIVVADERAPRDGKYIEKIGTYNPMLPKDNAERITFVDARVKYWLGEGAEPTDRVQRFLATANFVEARKIPEQTKKHLQSERTKMKINERDEKRKLAEAVAASAAEDAKAAIVAAVAEAEAPAEAPEEAVVETPAEAEAPAEAPEEAVVETPAEATPEA